MAGFSLPFTAVAVSVLLVIWVAAAEAAAAAAAASPSCALSVAPSSSSSRRVKRGDAYSAGDGRRSLGFERGKLLMEEALFGRLRILNTTILSGGSELLAPDMIVPVPPTNERHVWAMALSPKDGSLFFIMSDRIYKLPLDVGPGREKVVAIAGPWNNTNNESVAVGMAMEDPELAGSASPHSSSSARGRFLHIADCSNFALRAFDVNGTQLFSRSYRELFSGNNSEPLDDVLCVRKLAIDNARRVLYASSRYAIYRMNLTSETLSYPPVETWIGPRLIGPRLEEGEGFRDSQDPLEVRFNWAYISSHAISEDGQIIYVADMENDCIRRIRAATGAVDTIAGRNGSRAASEDGPTLNANFRSPVGLALTRDGCNLFVAEFHGANESNPSEFVGRLRLIQLNREGDALNVMTVASLDSPSSGHVLLSLALSPDEDRLYIGRGDMQIMVLNVNKGALFSCRAHRSRSQVPVVIVTTVTVTVALLLLVGTLIVIRCRRARRQWVRFSEDAGKGSAHETTSTEITTVSETGDSGQAGVLVRPSSILKQYSWKELAKACDGFSPSRIVGKGGAAEVYRGELAGGQKVAVKMMKGADFSESRFRQFQAELDVLATLRHMHLCSIIGYAAHQSRSFIVYPFVEGGTLYDRLQGAPPEPNPGDGDAPSPKGGGPLSWKARLSIARQVAKALRYLHEEVDPPVIHRDVKSKNVLLQYGRDGHSAKIRAYLSDFGLAKLGQSAFSSSPQPLLAGAQQPPWGPPPLLAGAQQPPWGMANIDLLTVDTPFSPSGGTYLPSPSGDTIQTLSVAGTTGYMAPEYMRSCWLTYKNDVYAFGVILLELVTGRKAFGRMDIFLPGPQQDARNGTEKGIPETLAYWAKRVLRSLECLSASDEEEGSREYTGTGVVPAAPLRSKASTKRAYSMKMNGVQELADPRLESVGGYDRRGMAAVLKLAMECVRTNPKRRPKMGEVLERLNRAEDGR